MGVNDSQLVNYVAEMLEPLGDVVIKRLFGGRAICINNYPVALTFKDVIYFKTNASNQPDYEAAGSKPFTYEKQGKTIIISNWELPAHVLEDQDLLLKWAEKSYKVAVSTKKRKKL